ncbi:MAG: alpha-galactosidase [Planctomycetaceae bacterium]|nr:alpha-galactosidase [Planctomycetaceae bacterium]
MTCRSPACACVLVAVIAASSPATAAEPKKFTLGSDDTIVTVEAADGVIAVTSLKSATGHDWLGGAASPLPLLAAAEVDGKSMPLTWKLKKASSQDGPPKRVEFVFECASPAMELMSVWEAFPGPGPVEHFLTITNRGPAPVTLTLQKSLSLDLRAAEGAALEHLWVEKGASIPTRFGTHLSPVTAGYSAELISGITWPYSKDTSRPNDPMPWTTLLDRKGREGVYMGIDFSGLVKIGLKGESPSRVKAVLGLGRDDQSEGQYRTRVAPGAAFYPAPVFVGCYQGDEDDGSNRLRRWVSAHVRPPAPGTVLPVLVNNSWGSGMAVDAKLARSMIDLSAAAGLEMFHIDAGWFRGVGDWNPEAGKFPQGLGPIADYAHSKKLKFGLWIAWTQGGVAQYPAGDETALSVHNEKMKPWFTKDYSPKWKTKAFVGADVCLGDPRAVDWCTRELRRCVKEYKLDLLEHDQRMIVDHCRRGDHLHTESRIDVTYHAAMGYYKVYDTLRRENPTLLFENCVNGAQMLDYGILRRTHYTSITDHYDPLNNRRALHDSVYYMPASMCESYVENHPGKTIGNFKYMLRSGMMGWCTIMLNMARWTPEQTAVGRRQFETYKQKLRPLIENADLFHISPRPDGANWDGLQYFDKQSGRGAVFAFRPRSPETKNAFKLKGLDAGAQYDLNYEDESSPATTISGKDLMEQGLPVSLGETDSSEIIWIQRK